MSTFFLWFSVENYFSAVFISDGKLKDVMKNLEKVKKAETIFEDITKLTREKGSDVPALNRFMKDNKADIERLVERLNNEERAERILSRVDEIDSIHDVDKILLKLKRKKILKRRTTTILISLTSAAAAIVVSFLLSNFSREKNSEVIIAYNAEVERPTLITEIGEAISLDSVNGNRKNVYAVQAKNSLDGMHQMVYNELVIPAHYTYQLILSDSSEVTLNAGSRIKFPVSFRTDVREVELSGEAYFKVVKSSKPFIVKSGNLSIKVYGTEFNVDLNGENAEAVLVEGSIGAAIEGLPEIMLQPNQLLSYNRKTNDYKLSETDTYLYTQWMDGNFKYMNKPLAEVLNDLSNWYGVDFIMNDKVKNIEVTLFSSRDSDVNEVLGLIEVAVSVKFIKEGGRNYSIE